MTGKSVEKDCLTENKKTGRPVGMPCFFNGLILFGNLGKRNRGHNSGA